MTLFAKLVAPLLVRSLVLELKELKAFKNRT
jgi:hypothetical protein